MPTSVPRPTDITDAVTAMGGLGRFALLLVLLLSAYAVFLLVRSLPALITRRLRSQNVATAMVIDMIAKIGEKAGVDLSQQQRDAKLALDGKLVFADEEKGHT